MPFPSAEKSADDLMDFPLYLMCYFSLTAFKILSLTLIFVIFNYSVSQHESLWVHLIWDFVLPGPGYLFPFPGQGSFQLISYNGNQLQ